VDATVIQTEDSANELQKEIETLKAKIAENDRELTRAEGINAKEGELLRNILDQIYALEIDPKQKRSMTDICLRLLQRAAMVKRMGIELTESDVLILSKLEKKHPNLDTRDVKICLLVKLNYNTKEIARNVGIAPRLRYKVHKKLGIGWHESIKGYMSKLAIA